MEITLSLDYGDASIEEYALDELAALVALAEDKPENTEVSITFVDDERMAYLNGEYRGMEGPTDVLSFECDNLDDDFDMPEGAPYELGDIVIAPDVAARNAQNYGVSLQEELELLVVHGVLHLCGWDHLTDEEADKMEARERELLAEWRAR